MNEPLCSRLFIVAGVLLGVIGATLIAERFFAFWYLFLMVSWIALLVAHAYFRRRRRTQRLPLGAGGHVIHRVIPAGAHAAVGLMFAFILLAPLNRAFPYGDVLFWLLVGLPAALILLYTVLAWRESFLALTPEGVVWRTGYASRTIPWDALATDGPLRPSLRETWLPLTVACPDLVTQRPRLHRRQQGQAFHPAGHPRAPTPARGRHPLVHRASRKPGRHRHRI